MTVRFDDRVALVTGAGRGIGREHALELASRGAAVVVNDLGGAADGTGADEAPAHEVVAAIRAAGGTAVANFDDVSTPQGAAASVTAATAAFGRLDMVVNNAGITLGDWPTMVGVHLSGTFYVCRAAWPLMVEQGGGRIVNTTSAAGLFGLTVDGPHGLDFFAYGAAKMGIVGLTRGLAIEGRRHGIRVNAISPVAHSRLTAWYPDPRTVAWMERHFPASKVAPAVAALLHQDCPLSGETFSVGGGRIARVFVGETLGVCEAQPTAEGVLARLDDVTDMEGFVVPADTADEMRVYRDRLIRRPTGS